MLCATGHTTNGKEEALKTSNLTHVYHQKQKKNSFEVNFIENVTGPFKGRVASPPSQVSLILTCLRLL